MELVQIYNEKVTDLLGDGESSLKIKMDSENKFYVNGARNVEVRSREEVEQWLEKGLRKRMERKTALNECSSRSHLILSLTVTTPQGHQVRTSRLNLVDLAGSERVAQSKVSGHSLKEAIFINSSLFTLAKLVATLEKQSLGGKKDKKTVVNYRESKLTMLLKESLGGNCRTVVIGTLSPSQ